MQVCSSGPAHHPLPLAGLSCSRSSAPRCFSGRFFLTNCHQTAISFHQKVVINCLASVVIKCNLAPFFTFLTFSQLVSSNHHPSLALNQEMQVRGHRRAQYECSAPSNASYFLRLINHFSHNQYLALCIDDPLHLFRDQVLLF